MSDARQWADTAIWWHVYPLGFVGADTTSEPARRRSSTGCAGIDGLARLPARPGLQRARARPRLRLRDPRLRHHRPPADRPPAGRRGRRRRAVRRLPGARHPGAARRRVQPRRRGPTRVARGRGGGPGLPAAARFATGPGARRSTASRCRCSRATTASSRSTTTTPRSRGRQRRHGALARPRHRRLAPRRRLRRPASFWAAPSRRCGNAFPDAWFVGEVIHGDYVGFVEESGLDSVTQYELWKSIWSALNERNLLRARLVAPPPRRVRSRRSCR